MMKIKKSAQLDWIKPLFLPFDDLSTIGNQIIKLARDDYNKAIGSALIDAKDDAQAISSFLREFSDSPLTLKSYAKEIERLLLWCIHVAKSNVSSLRRDHLIEYQNFLKHVAKNDRHEETRQLSSMASATLKGRNRKY